MESLFKNHVFLVVSKIPKGSVMTYAGVARAAGKPRAARAVGNILNTNRDFKAVPCHRVVRSNGVVGGYVNGENQKVKKLVAEGVKIQQGRIDLTVFGI